MKLPYSIDEFNKMVDRISEKGYIYPTKGVYMTDRFRLALVAPELKGAGHIRTYQQAVEYSAKGTGKSVDYIKTLYTEKDYIEDLETIKNKLGPLFDEQGYYDYKRDMYVNQIYDALGEKIDLTQYSTVELGEILNEAWRRTKRDSGGSPTFSEHLREVLNEWAQ